MLSRNVLVSAVAVLALASSPVTASIKKISVDLFASDATVQYEQGYIRGPGSIDLSNLEFEAIGMSLMDALNAEDDEYDEADYYGEEDPDYEEEPFEYGEEMEGYDESTEEYEEEIFEEYLEDSENGGGGRKRRRLFWPFGVKKHKAVEEELKDEDEEAQLKLDESAIDIVIFPLKKECARKEKCDWEAHGIGKQSSVTGELQWCCNDAAINEGLCDQKSLGRLLKDEKVFQGSHVWLKVPAFEKDEEFIKQGFTMEQLTDQDGVATEAETGPYAVMYANCNSLYGREVIIKGKTIWKSNHGYLPGELYGFMYFYFSVAAIYFVLFSWFSLMRFKHQEHSIDIEKWIMVAIALGLTEMIFRSTDYMHWNHTGERVSLYIWVGLTAGVLKQAMSRVLMVVVSMGWGILRDDLGDVAKQVLTLGGVYISVSAVLDFLMIFAMNNITTLSDSHEAEIFTVVKGLKLLRGVINVIFALWIGDALARTIRFLETMEEPLKLQRMKQVRTAFFGFIFLSTGWAVFSLVDTYQVGGVIEEQHAWAKDAGKEFNYLLLLISIAVLWRPSANARDYAYSMHFADGDKMIEVPSAIDEPDNTEDSTDGSF